MKRLQATANKRMKTIMKEVKVFVWGHDRLFRYIPWLCPARPSHKLAEGPHPSADSELTWDKAFGSHTAPH